MNELKTFTYQNEKVRTIEQNNEPWFVLKDVCDILGISKYRDTASRLDEDERGSVRVDTPGGEQEMTAVNESGLYNVILRSDKPEAKPFRKWVTSEVLPSIRKHGMYAVDELIENPDLAIAALTALKEERAKSAKLETTVAVQEQQIAEMKPKASYYDLILNCKDLVSIGKIAKDYGKSAQWLNTLLHDKGIQYKQGNIWLLYQKYAEKGYTSTKTHNYIDDKGAAHSKIHTFWTQKGRLFIYGLLKNDGILPTMEKNSVA